MCLGDNDLCNCLIFHLTWGKFHPREVDRESETSDSDRIKISKFTFISELSIVISTVPYMGLWLVPCHDC